MNVEQVLDRTASKFPEKPAIIFKEQIISFHELRTKVIKFANGLAAMGVKKGDCVAIYLGNGPGYAISYLSIFCLRAVVVPLDWNLKEELVNCLRFADVKVLITQKMPNANYGAILQQCPKLKHILFYEDQVQDLIKKSSEKPINAHISESDPSTIFFTTGTTGKPKGILWNYRHLDGAPKIMEYFLKTNSNDINLCAVPFSHCGGLVYLQNCVFYGITIIILERFHPLRFVKAVKDYNVTSFHIVPAMYEAILSLRGIESWSLPSLRCVEVFGAPSSPELLQRFGRLCPQCKCLNGYGLTETAPPNVLHHLDRIKRGSVGISAPWIEMNVLDEQDNPLPTGQIGEVAFKGWVVMNGYYKAPELTDKVIKNGWFHTGDLGKLDEEGYLFILGRKKEVIIVGGMNVYATEVESVISAHPAVKEVAVVGIPDKLRGEAVKAVIALHKDAVVEKSQIISHCRQRLAHFKIPRSIEFVNELPKVGIGKVDKKKLQ